MSRTETKISGLVITFNEEKNIEEVIQNLYFCDEILIIDSFSTDHTVHLAQQFPKVKIIQNVFEDFSKQRNLALSEAENDWVLFLDADERLTPALTKEIQNTVASDHAAEAYYFYRTFFVGKQKIRFSGTQNDKNFRLFRKSKAEYVQEKKVHETLHVKGKTGVLKNKLLHYSFENYDAFKSKMLFYGNLKGVELYQKGKRYDFLTQWSKTIFKFVKTFFIKMGILDGKNGLIISYLQSLYVYQTHESLKKQERENLPYQL